MLDIHQERARNHLRSSYPIDHRSNGNCVRTRTKDFDFWAEQRTKNDEKCDNSCRSEVDFEMEEDDYGAYSPRLWRTSSFRYEAEASLLPHDHHYSYPSPNSRLQAILDGRRELMEMVQDMPESCYELSLKDIVDEEHLTKRVEQDEVMSEKSLNADSEGAIMKTKKKISKKGRISRSGSMDSGVFLLKMFFPTSLGLNKKSRKGNCSKVSPKPSTEWWKITSLLVLRDSTNRNGGTGRSRISGSNSSSDNNNNENAESDLTPGCWSFNAKNRRTGRKRGCLF